VTQRVARRVSPGRAGRSARALAHLRHLDADVVMDPALPDRVLAALGFPVACPAGAGSGRRGFFRRLARALRSLLRIVLAAAALLLAAGPPPARAGPVEARAAWKEAQALKLAPWNARVRAYRAVRAATTPTDSVYARALAAEGAALRDAGRVHAAAAAEAWAAALGPASDPDRAGALLRQAKNLRAEGDDDAAKAPLQAAAKVGRTAVPWEADEALDVLAEDAQDRRDEAGLRTIVQRLEAERARPSSRIEGWSRLGVLVLGRGDADEARRCLAKAERAYRDGEKADPREAARATKAWLDAALRRALASARG
jgi:hypothetical protein